MSAYGPNLAWGDHVAIVGLQQTGKSTLARELVSGARRVVYVDPKGDHAREVRRAMVIEPIALEDSALLAERRCRIVVRVGRSGLPVAQEVKYILRRVREEEERNGFGTVLLLDELVLYSASAGEQLRALMASGHGIAPKYGGIVSLMVAQRAVDLPLGCRALATRAYSFRQSHPRDLERLADEFGDEFAERARTWKAGEEPAYWEQERFYR